MLQNIISPILSWVDVHAGFLGRGKVLYFNFIRCLASQSLLNLLICQNFDVFEDVCTGFVEIFKLSELGPFAFPGAEEPLGSRVVVTTFSSGA